MSFVTAVSGNTYLKVEENLGDGYVRLNISEAERRQAKHDIRSIEDVLVELLRNSRDAHANRIWVATGREGDTRRLVVIDDGVGVPDQMQERVFEPRVTSKLDTMVVDNWGVHGRGMALFSVRSNAEEARIVCSAPHKGTAIAVATNAAALAERSDQSTWPIVERDEEGVMRAVKGPHNLPRRTAEFAIEHQGVDVFFGSPAEILATMVMLARFELAEADLLFCEDDSRLSLWARPGATSSAMDLARVGESLGIFVSERTAHRILAGEIAPVSPVLARFTRRSDRPDTGMPDIYRDQRGLKVHHGDLAAFKHELERAFDSLAEKYYLSLKCEPKVTVGRDEIRVRFDIDKED